MPAQVIDVPTSQRRYTSFACGRTLREAGIAQSMGSRGDAYDNALAEAFMSTFKTELIDRRSWPTRHQARTAIYDYTEGWYNPRRRHSALGYESPAHFEAQYHPQQEPAAQKTCPSKGGDPRGSSRWKGDRTHPTRR